MIVPISYTDSKGKHHEHTGFFAWVIALLVVGFIGIVFLFIAALLLSPIWVLLLIGFGLGKLF